jgi:hypothetical protein
MYAIWNDWYFLVTVNNVHAVNIQTMKVKHKLAKFHFLKTCEHKKSKNLMMKYFSWHVLLA